MQTTENKASSLFGFFFFLCLRELEKGACDGDFDKTECLWKCFEVIDDSELESMFTLIYRIYYFDSINREAKLIMFSTSAQFKWTNNWWFCVVNNSNLVSYSSKCKERIQIRMYKVDHKCHCSTAWGWVVVAHYTSTIPVSLGVDSTLVLFILIIHCATDWFSFLNWRMIINVEWLSTLVRKSAMWYSDRIKTTSLTPNDWYASLSVLWIDH